MNYIFDAMKEYKTGLSLHYPLLYSIIIGLETKHAFEFGAGWSTRVILDALKNTDGYLCSISTDSQKDVMLKNRSWHSRGGVCSDYLQHWTHTQGRTPEAHKILVALTNKPLDFVLHDGSHTGEVVYQDLKFILPKMKYNSILCVHDVLHEHCGKDMRDAVSEAIKEYEYEIVTLPYGYGLSIITIKDNKENGIVQINRKKPGSKYYTEVI
jgi:predicted O-methyltransferase YrrM